MLKLLAWLGVAVVLLALPAWRKIGPRRGRQAAASKTPIMANAL